MSSPGPTLVTGANGFIGSHLVDRLLEDGIPVRALVRPSSDLEFLDPRAEVVRGDLSRPFSLQAALEDVDAIYHVAGVVAAFRRRTYREVNETGTRLLLRACRKIRPDLTRFVLVSSLAATGPSREGRPRREDETPRPVSVYGASKLAGERAAFTEAGRIPVTVVRPPIVYGPRDRDMLTLFRLARAGLLPGFPREKFYSVIHVRDLVRGIVLAGRRPVAAGRIYHLADRKARALTHLLGLIAAAVGGSRRRIPVPSTVLPLVGGISDALAPGLGLPIRPIGDKAREVRPDYWVASTARAEADLGFTTRVSLEDGIAETARFYVGRRWIEPVRA